MKRPQLNFSLEGGNFLRVAEGLINFGYNGLPDKVHFSISSQPKSSMVNLHISKEVPYRDNKPQISIFEMLKSDWKIFRPLIAKSIFACFFEPLAMPYQQDLSRKDFFKKVAFLSFDDLPHISSIWDKQGIKKGKLRLTEKGLIALNDWAAQPRVQQQFAKQFFTLPWRCSIKPQNGFLLSPGYNGPVLILKGRYYKQCESLRPKAILNHLLGDSLARMLIVKTYRAIKDIQTTPDRN
ncbi:MAG: hypothetical protein JWP37_3751, partial [Mucilaginibacter sp.]|nr:hypothetical protein [Mucilaginibacter sp.]